VQFCPDAARAEVANVGVLLFSPGHKFIEVCLSKNIKHVQSVFHGLDFDAKQVDMMKKWLKDRVSVQKDNFHSVDDLNHFISTRFNEMVLTAPRSIVVEKPAKLLEALYNELVATREKVKQAVGEEGAAPLFPEMDTFFKRSKFSGMVQFDQQLTVPVSGKQIDIPYVFTNGCISYVKPENIINFEAAEKRLVDGWLLTEHGNIDGMTRELLVLAKIEKPKLREQVTELSAKISNSHVRFFLESRSLLAELEEKAIGH